MKHPATNASKRRPRRRRFGRRRFWFVPLVVAPLGLIALFLTGRALGLLSTKPTAPLSSLDEQSEARARETARNTSLGRSLEKLDAQTLSAYFDRFSKPDAARPGETANVSSVVDEAELVRRHPAWQLADALESGSLNPAAPREVRTSGLFSSTNGASASSAAVDFSNLNATITGSRRVQAGARASGSSGEIDDFGRALAARDAARARDEAILARRALEDSIANTERARVEGVDLALVPPDLALELLNLRLELGRNVANTDAARARARARIAQIEARLDAIWKRQTDEAAARLRAALEEGPARLRREGLARLEAEERARRLADAAARATLRAELERLTGEASRANRTPLTLVLPPARVPRSGAAFVDEAQMRGLIKTRAGVAPSNAPQTQIVSDGRRASALESEIARLRALARSETRRFVIRDTGS